MYNLTNDELRHIRGGAISFGAGLLIGAGIVFLIGVIDGYIRPLKCNWTYNNVKHINTNEIMI